MAESHVISALVAKHSQLQGDIIEYSQKLSVLEKELRAIEETIAIFDENYKVSKIAPKKSSTRYFKKGELTKKIIIFLKNNQSGFVVDDIIDHIVKDIPSRTKQSYRINVYQTLKSLVLKGLITNDLIDGVKHYRIK